MAVICLGRDPERAPQNLRKSFDLISDGCSFKWGELLIGSSIYHLKQLEDDEKRMRK